MIEPAAGLPGNFARRPGVSDPGRYRAFLESSGSKSGVSYRQALSSGLDLDAFRRAGSGAVGGTLVLKIWPGRRTGLLWAYLLADGGDPLCFPVFRGAGDRPYAGIASFPLGTRVEAVLAAGRSGGAVCRHAEVSA